MFDSPRPKNQCAIGMLCSLALLFSAAPAAGAVVGPDAFGYSASDTIPDGWRDADGGTELVLLDNALEKGANLLDETAAKELIRDNGSVVGVRARDPLTLAAITVVLAVVSLIACLVPARRASRIDPAVRSAASSSSPAASASLLCQARSAS